MIYYFDTSAILKRVKPEEEEAKALSSWRETLEGDAELVTSILSELEVTRSLLRVGTDHSRVPYLRQRALDGLWLHLINMHTLKRAKDYEMQKLGSLDAIHLATAQPHRGELSAFVTYDKELANAARELDLPVLTPA